MKIRKQPYRFIHYIWKQLTWIFQNEQKHPCLSVLANTYFECATQCHLFLYNMTPHVNTMRRKKRRWPTVTVTVSKAIQYVCGKVLKCFLRLFYKSVCVLTHVFKSQSVFYEKNIFVLLILIAVNYFINDHHTDSLRKNKALCKVKAIIREMFI